MLAFRLDFRRRPKRRISFNGKETMKNAERSFLSVQLNVFAAILISCIAEFVKDESFQIKMCQALE